MKIVFSCLLTLFVCYASIGQVKHDAVGKVVSAETGEPLVGATVTALETGEFVETNGNGRFSIAVADLRSQLQISFVGYHTKILALERETDSISVILLEPNSRLIDEVEITTGYETIPRERATGSFEKIDASLFNRSPGPDVLSRLDGITTSTFFDKREYDVNGLNNKTSLMIRGISTIRGDMSPLVVLDNFPYEGDINNINPNDVASVTLLKDAAATSIWGARAGNGVIVITSKKATFDTRPTVSFSSNVTISGKPDLFASPEISSAEFIDVERFLFNQGFYNNQETDRGKPALSPVVELLIKVRDGVLTQAEADYEINRYSKIDVRNDFLNFIYRQPVNQQYAFNLSGGEHRFTYNLSAGLDKNLYNINTNSYNRTTLKFGNQIRLLKNLTIASQIIYTANSERRHSSYERFGYGQISVGNHRLYPYAQLADEQGNALPIPFDHRQHYIDTAGGGALLPWDYYPLTEARLDGERTNGKDILFNTGITYQFLPALSAELKYQYHHGFNQGEDHRSAESYYTRNLINRFTQIDGTTVTHFLPVGGILHLRNREFTSHSFRGQLSYRNELGQRSSISGILGAEVRTNSSEANSHGVYGYDSETRSFANIDYLTRYPIYDNLASPSVIPSMISFSGSLDRFISFYGNFAYVFNGRYTLSASVRRDASNLFGVASNNKWSPFWSVGAKWNVSDEAFYSLDAIPYLSMRMTYGFSGNTDNSMSGHTTIRYASYPDFVSNRQFAYIERPPNPTLRWEKVATLNIGADLSTRNNRISGSLEYYIKNSSDLFGSAPLDPSTGFSSLLLNSANTRGNGFDVQVTSRNLIRNFQWSTTILASYNKTIVKKYLAPPARANVLVANNGRGVTPIENEIAFPIISYRWEGLDPENGDPIGYYEGEKSKDYSNILRNTPMEDLVLHGSAKPLYFGAIRNMLSWKGLTLSANVVWRFDYYFRRRSIRYNSLFVAWASHTDFNDRWQRTGDERKTDVPSLVYPGDGNRDEFYTNAEVLVERGDHIRLQDIRLSVDLSPSFLRKIGATKAQVYAMATNLGLLWSANRYGLDPEYAFSNIPAPRSYSLGLNFSF